MRAQFVTAKDVQKILGVSRSKAYQILQGMNRELKAKGYITISGKCPVSYFEQKFYGLRIDDTFLNQVSYVSALLPSDRQPREHDPGNRSGLGHHKADD